MGTRVRLRRDWVFQGGGKGAPKGSIARRPRGGRGAWPPRPKAPSMNGPRPCRREKGASRPTRGAQRVSEGQRPLGALQEVEDTHTRPWEEHRGSLQRGYLIKYHRKTKRKSLHIYCYVFYVCRVALRLAVGCRLFPNSVIRNNGRCDYGIFYFIF